MELPYFVVLVVDIDKMKMESNCSIRAVTVGNDEDDVRDNHDFVVLETLR